MDERMIISNLLRKLWEQHVMWTRSFVISAAHDLKDIEFVTKRLLENPTDFAKVLRQFYGEDIALQFEELLKEHILIAADIVKAMKANDSKEMESLLEKWYYNADQIAKFLSEINPYWDEEEWRAMLSSHLVLLEKEIMNRISGNYEEDVAIYDIIEDQALEMADYMSDGIIEQFQI